MTISKPILITVCSFLFLAWLMFFKMISPGHVGVVVNLFGSDKGIETKELHVGMHWVAPWKRIYKFPVFEQNVIWEGQEDRFYFQTGEGLGVSADIGMTFSLNPSKVPNIYQKYRRGMNEITNVFMRNYVRDAVNAVASNMKIEDLYGKEKESFLHSVESSVKSDLEPLGFNIHRVYLLHRINMPDAIVESLNLKISATQRAQQRENELREVEAQAMKEIAMAKGRASALLFESEAEAKANKIISESITPNLISWNNSQKWDGHLPTVTGDSIPMLNMGSK